MTKILAFTLAPLVAACMGTGTGTADVRYGAAASVSTPQFVEVYPDVQVISDYHEPVFYTDNTYWLYRDDGWYQSSDYRGGWVRIEAPPPRIRRIERPQAYVRYRGRVEAQPQPIAHPRDHRDHDVKPQGQPDREAEERRKHDINVQRQNQAEAEAKRKHDINVQRQQQQAAEAEAKRKHDMNVQRQQQQAAEAEAKRKHDINAKRQQEADAEARRKHDINAKRQQDQAAEAEAKRKHDINKARAR